MAQQGWVGDHLRGDSGARPRRREDNQASKAFKNRQALTGNECGVVGKRWRHSGNFCSGPATVLRAARTSMENYETLGTIGEGCATARTGELLLVASLAAA